MRKWMKEVVKTDKKYTIWLKDLKSRVRSVQIKAMVKVNTEMLNFYWELGMDIVEKQSSTSWGDGFLKQLSSDLMKEFPSIKGFSKRNLELVRKWFLFYSTINTIAKQAVSQLKTQKVQQAVALITQVPWGHNIAIMNKCKNINEALFYISSIIKNGWSRSILIHQIESDLYKRKGKSISNFDHTLPSVQSDLAKETLKNPYVFDFLNLREKHDEKEFENELLNQVSKFLLELGAGFSFIGRQYKLEVGGDEFYMDLLFYHVKLHCYVVIELKTTKFKPEFSGKLNFYISVVDGIIKSKQDNPTIGILICKSKNNTVVEYSVKDINKPIGVSEYIVTKKLPNEFKSTLPTIKEIEDELKK
ncbi:MAG: PDDEXK nuclease domain-containing protein [Candidatus Delongbacteria bacterium]|nr:PDDEXK nuclease domain-containing protein [Candidatus Delongbacteria bacterium]